MFESLILFTEWFANAYGLLGVFIISLLESFIFPVPTSVIIAPVAAFGIDPFFIMVVATVGSVLGAIVGYFLGKRLGRPVADRLFRKHVPRVEKWFKKWGAWAVLLAAFSPIPFKVFTWCAGIFELDMKKFLIASVIGRSAQFFVAAYVGAWLGPGIISWFFGIG